jgi:hypothetical protein
VAAMGIGKLFTAVSLFAVCAAVPGLALATAERPELVLPAGLYFRSGHYEMRACTACKAPKVVATAGIFANAREAENAVKALAEGTLPQGYPWVVHTDELGLADATMRGIAVVTGLFASYEDANAWRSANAISVTNARLTALADDDEYGERTRKGVDTDFQRTIVVQVDSNEDVPAYSEDDLVRIEKTSKLAAEDLATLTPKCRVSGKSVFTFPRERTRGSELVYRFHRALHPVRCGRTVAYVAASTTRFESVSGRGKDGRAFIRQVVDVANEDPTIVEWRIDATGKAGTRGKSRVMTLSSGS